MNLNQAAHYVANAFHKEFDNELKIGRASCRERV